MSIFFPHIQCTEASYHVCVSQQLIINVMTIVSYATLMSLNKTLLLSQH